MKNIILISILFFNSCSTFLSELEKTIGTNVTLEQLLSTPQENFPLKGWHPDYDLAIELAAKEFPITVPCNNPKLFFKSLAFPESAHDRRSTYREPPPLGYDSLGLLQLSLEDEKVYKCGFKTREDVYHPIRNLYCGVKILNKLQTKYAGKSIYWQGGQYWSVLRNPENWPNRKYYNGLKSFKKEMSKGGCKL